jgi:hypothetical protein
MKEMIYYVCEPWLDQSLTILHFLNRYCPEKPVFCLINDTESAKPIYCSNSFLLQEISLPDNELQIIPTGAYSTSYLLQYQDVKIGQITLTKEAIRLYDKLWAIEAAQSMGIPTPTTWRHTEEISYYPVFYKQSYEKGGGQRGIAKEKSEIPVDEEMIFQELIQGRGTYGVSFLADRGMIILHHTHHEIESYPKQGGSAVIIENFSNDKLLEYSNVLIKSLNYSGWGLIEYKYCPKRDDFVFMEINAKFWASCAFTFRNNPLFLKLLFDIELKEKPVNRMIFLDRAAARGPLFLLMTPKFLKLGTVLHVYPGWIRRLVLRFIPAPARCAIRRIVLRRTRRENP